MIITSPDSLHPFVTPPAHRSELHGPRAATKGDAPASLQYAGTLWIGIFAGCILAFVLAGCAAVEKVVADLDEPSATATITSVSLVDFSLDGATLAFDVTVDNPYAVELPLVDLEWSVESDGMSVLAGRFEPGESIAANGSTTFVLPASLRFADLLSVLGGGAPGAIVPYELAATLSVDTPLLGRLSLPLQRSGELPVPAIPEVELQGIAWDALSMDEARAVLRVVIVNSNEFPLSLDTMFYDLALGGTAVARTSVQESVELGEGDDTVIEIPISFRPMDLGLAMFKMLTGDGAAYEFAGTLEVGTPFGPLSLPFERRGETVFTRQTRAAEGLSAAWGRLAPRGSGTA